MTKHAERFMKILVTGASGFIGGRFARHALEQGFEVRVNGRRGEGVAHLVRRGAQFVEGDLADPHLAQRLCIGVDAVVHCAGMGGHWGRAEDLQRNIVEATENLVEGCLKEHVRRLVHLSCASLYRNGHSRLALKEDALPRRFYDPATRCRYLAEQKVFGAAEFGLEVLALRPAPVLGAGDANWLPRLVNLQGKHRLSIIGNGLNKVDFTSVHNLSEALLSSLLADPAALGKAYNISNGTPLPLWDVLNYALRRLQLPQVTRYRGYRGAWLMGAVNEGACLLWPGRPQPRWSRYGAHSVNADFTLDIARARHHLDYQPQVTLWAALDEFCAWWQAAH
jgi:nucleoside-diphosphate-sugar epimerase